jgi:fumarylacetoacetase
MDHQVFSHETLNKFMAFGAEGRKEARESIQSLFAAGNDKIPQELREKSVFKASEVEMHMPVFIRDYTDFYSSKNHAFNVGCMFRGPENALQPNWLHLPVGYHGRASSIVKSGTPIRRPKGQVSADKKTPNWSQCMRLDLELEMGTFIGTPNQLGDPVTVEDARNHIFGYCLLNDWSARDL